MAWNKPLIIQSPAPRDPQRVKLDDFSDYVQLFENYLKQHSQLYCKLPLTVPGRKLAFPELILGKTVGSYNSIVAQND
jgi:hypothetical protein